MNILKSLSGIIKSSKNLEEKLFWSLTLLVASLTFLSLILTLIENTGLLSVISVVVCLIIPICFLFICKRVEKYSFCYFLQSILLSGIFIPIVFFTNGGFQSGVPLYMIGGVIISCFNVNKKYRYISFVISTLASIIAFVLSLVCPQLIIQLPENFVKLDIILSFVFICMGTLPLSSVFFGEYRNSIVRAEKEAEKKMDFRIELMQAQLDNVADVKRMRHDLRHHNALVYEYAQNNDLEGLKRYLMQKMDTDDYYATKIFCMNSCVNNILTVYSRKARRDDIRVDIAADVSNDIHVSEPDLMAIISNVFENAINGAVKSSSNDKNISINITTYDNKIVIKCSNSCDDSLKLVDGYPGERPGTGINSIIKAIKNYDGTLSYKIENKTVFCTIILFID